MIIISGTFKIRSDKIDDAIAAMKEMATASQQEEGCHHYQFYQDLHDPATFLIYEEWENAEALAAHGETPHMAVLRGKMPDIVASPPQVNRYEATAMG